MVVTGERQPEPRAGSATTADDQGPTPAGDAHPASSRPELRHEPALDGLRGLAVAVVVLFHLERLDGGFLGVDLFFLLSVYLITSLLLVEQTRTGGINLGAFWARRARRLLPALFVLVAGVAVLIMLFTPADQRPDFRGDGMATLGYVANWNALADGEADYWALFDDDPDHHASPLEHAWSLAIEEQFYLLWPLVVLAAVVGGHRLVSRRRSGLTGRRRTTGPARTTGGPSGSRSSRTSGPMWSSTTWPTPGCSSTGSTATGSTTATPPTSGTWPTD